MGKTSDMVLKVLIPGSDFVIEMGVYMFYFPLSSTPLPHYHLATIYCSPMRLVFLFLLPARRQNAGPRKWKRVEQCSHLDAEYAENSYGGVGRLSYDAG